MNKTISFIKDYKNNNNLRASFNDLANTTFGINFESWYEHGYWTSKYIPYSFVKDNKIIANASVNIIPFVVNNEMKKAVQIGTVMTHPEFRNQGLARKLMDMILYDYQTVDMVYLFANPSVLDFYPKFGFHAVGETQYSKEFTGKPNGQVIQRLHGNRKEDLQFIYDFSKRNNNTIAIFDTVDTSELLMFYCMYVFPEDIYYIPQEDVLILCQKEENTLHVFKVISEKPYHIDQIISYIVDDHTNEVVLHFTPEDNLDAYSQVKYEDSNTLFVKYNHPDMALPKHFKHPITSQA